jgi:hypothetical protein
MMGIAGGVAVGVVDVGNGDVGNGDVGNEDVGNEDVDVGNGVVDVVVGIGVVHVVDPEVVLRIRTGAKVQIKMRGVQVGDGGVGEGNMVGEAEGEKEVEGIHLEVRKAKGNKTVAHLNFEVMLFCYTSHLMAGTALC